MTDCWNPGIAFASETDVGMRRINNQDSLACLPAATDERFRSYGHLFIVADGMGAHAAGELASKIATDQIAMHYFRSTSDDRIDALRKAVTQANTEIHERGQSNPEFHNMGTTASSLLLVPAGAVAAHVGDSRVYRLRRGVFEQLTFDHSLVWEVEASGQQDSGVFGTQIPKNVITRSLGPHESVEVDVEGPFPVASGDRYLVCSDGLTGLVEDCEIGALMDCLPEDLAARVLVDLANLRGGPDNTTVVIVHAESDSAFDARRVQPKREDGVSKVSPFMVSAMIFCIAGAAVLGALQSWGPMVIAIMLGLIAASVTLVMTARDRASRELLTEPTVGQAPYRRYDATPTSDLYDRLGKTIQELRDAATERNWLIDWKRIDKYQRQGKQALQSKDVKRAIGEQAHAIVETMCQLREHHNRASNETTLDH